MPANCSYFFGNDTSEFGWGPRYFFSFYSELGGDLRQTAAVVEASVLIIVAAAALTANCAIAGIILRNREMRGSVTNAFLLNLAAADLVFALGAPLVAVARLTPQWTLGDPLCKALPYSQFVCGSVLLWTLTLISMDRHQCIVVAPYKSSLSPQKAGLLAVATWVVAGLLFLPITFWFREQQVQSSSPSEKDLLICTLIFPRSDLAVEVSLLFTLPTVLVACVLPMILLVVYHHRILRKLFATRSRLLVAASASSQPSSRDSAAFSRARRDSQISISGIVSLDRALRKLSISSRLSVPRGSLSQHEEQRLNKHLRVVRLLLLNVALVLFMWLPITIILVLIYVDGRRPTHEPLHYYFLRSRHFVWALIMALLNTVVNPLLYGVFSENFRTHLTKLWGSANHAKFDIFRFSIKKASIEKTNSSEKNCNSAASKQDLNPEDQKSPTSVNSFQIRG